MSKVNGFQHNQIFKITSMKDKNVIEVVKTLNGGVSPVVTKPSTTGQNQKIKSFLIRPGEFRICAIDATGPPQAWAFQPSQPVVYQTPWQDVPNQAWQTVEIYPNSKICFIKSKANGWCMRNEGVGKQISIVPENRLDPNQHWKCEPTY